MEKYKVIKEVGSGQYGSVFGAINKQTGKIAAIKRLKRKYNSWEECMNLREVKSLRKFSNHPNIVKLKEIILEHGVLYLVFEYMECNLYDLMKDMTQPFSEYQVRNWFLQVFRGLAYLHQNGYLHRDLKPENLLISRDTIKIADLGLAREIDSKTPYTGYVATRWYRAPEILLRSPLYGPAADMWAMGAIMAELFTLRPLFPGSSEADQMYKICHVLGSPTQHDWAEGFELAGALNYQFPQVSGIRLALLIQRASPEAIDLIRSLCSWDPCKRPTASNVLQHPFFRTCFYVPPSLRPAATVASTSGPGISCHPETRNFLAVKTHELLGLDMQRKPEEVYKQYPSETSKILESGVEQQPRYRPQIMCGSAGYERYEHGLPYAAVKSGDVTHYYWV